jgi:hypothetical protein
MAAGLLFLLTVRLAYARRPSVTAQLTSKWLVKWMRIKAATVENAFFVCDKRRITLSSKWAVKVHHICVFIPFSVSE